MSLLVVCGMCGHTKWAHLWVDLQAERQEAEDAGRYIGACGVAECDCAEWAEPR